MASIGHTPTGARAICSRCALVGAVAGDPCPADSRGGLPPHASLFADLVALLTLSPLLVVLAVAMLFDVAEELRGGLQRLRDAVVSMHAEEG